MNGELLKRLRIDGPYAALEHAFAEGKKERMTNLRTYLQEEQNRLRQ